MRGGTEYSKALSFVSVPQSQDGTWCLIPEAVAQVVTPGRSQSE